VLSVGSVPLLTADFCSGEKGVGRSGKPLHYKNSIFHRIIPNFMVRPTRREQHGGVVDCRRLCRLRCGSVSAAYFFLTLSLLLCSCQ